MVNCSPLCNAGVRGIPPTVFRKKLKELTALIADRSPANLYEQWAATP
ncbi:MAG: hypothetical protein WCD42_05530 [Rhizomicrobium sp.]